MTSTCLKAALGFALAVASVATARADVQFEERGPVAYLTSRHLRPGDEQEVQQFLDAPRAQPLRIIYLNSRGGNPRVGMAIGQMIRERGLDTGYHAGRARCVSACTAMYLGGVHRYYLGGERVRDGVETGVGLGFHTPRHPQQEGEDVMNGYYQEMGAPAATSLRYHVSGRDNFDAPFEGVGRRGRRPIYFAGSRTALKTGVATSRNVPAALRD